LIEHAFYFNQRITASVSSKFQTLKKKKKQKQKPSVVKATKNYISQRGLEVHKTLSRWYI
jgi:hypothetical protein